MIRCHECGEQITVTERLCPHCGATIDVSTPIVGNDNEACTKWSREGEKIKIQWVIAVVAFWVTVAIQVVVYFYHGKLNFILLSIAGGMLTLGMWLKVRHGLHMRKGAHKSH